jgi:hypothetical protein
LITAARHWLVYLRDNWIDSSHFSTLLLDLSTRPGEQSTCRRFCVSSTDWLRVPQRIEFRLAVLVYRCLHGTAPQYLADGLQRVDDISSRSRLRSASSAPLQVPRSKHKTIGDRAFPVAGANVWNGLPPSITSAPSRLQFRRALKTELFRRSGFPCCRAHYMEYFAK